MFGFPSTRIAEPSQPTQAQELAEYARLEYPHEEPRTIVAQALEEARGVPRRGTKPAPRGWLGRLERIWGVTPDKL